MAEKNERGNGNILSNIPQSPTTRGGNVIKTEVHHSSKGVDEKYNLRKLPKKQGKKKRKLREIFMWIKINSS